MSINHWGPPNVWIAVDVIIDVDIVSTMPSMVSVLSLTQTVPGFSVASVMPSMTSSGTMYVGELFVGHYNNINIVVKSRNIDITVKSRNINT